MTDYILDPCILGKLSLNRRPPNTNNEKRRNGWVCSYITGVINVTTFSSISYCSNSELVSKIN